MIRWTVLDTPRDEAERLRVIAWLKANGFDPARVPWDARIAHDSETDEFLVEYYERPWRIEGDRPARVTVRRRRVEFMRFEESA